MHDEDNDLRRSIGERRSISAHGTLFDRLFYIAMRLEALWSSSLSTENYENTTYAFDLAADRYSLQCDAFAVDREGLSVPLWPAAMHVDDWAYPTPGLRATSRSPALIDSRPSATHA